MKRMPGFIEVRNPLHEEIQSYSLTATLSRERAIDPPELRKFAADLMASVSAACFRYGAKDVGHIKAHIEHESGFLSADTLGDPADVMVEGRDGDPVRSFRIIVNSVIFGLAGERIGRATEESLEAVSLKFGLEKEQNDTGDRSGK